MPTKFIKKIGTLFFLISTILNFSNYTQAKDYEYTNLDITANVLIDGTINVKEDFTTNFFVNKHGIIRTIPLNYTVEGHNFHIDVSDIYVEGKNFSTNKSNGEIEIKIGDADRTVIGKQNYPISYSVYGLIRNFSGMGYAELYWNLVGYDFDTNINKVHAEIILPKIYTGFTADDFLITTDGSTTSVDKFLGNVDWSQGNKVIIDYDKTLPSYQGITLSIRFPNNYFTFDHERQAKLVGHTNNSFGDFIPWIVSILGITTLIIGIRKKLNNFRGDKIDRKSGNLKGELAKQFPVIVQYEPPKGINSAEAGLLIHREAKAKDMLSLIYKWASEGLIRLSFEEEEGSFFKKATKNIIITKIKDINPESPAYEKDFFKALIRIERNKISGDTNLYNKLGLSTLEYYGVKNGRFTGRKNKGGLIFFGFIALMIVMNIFEGTYPRVSFLAFLGFFAIIIYSATNYQLKETEKGARLISHVLGYREFLAACDENKLRLFLQQDPLYFDKILPYAIAFGLDTELIKKIEPLMQEMNIKSSWYDGDIHSIYYINNIISSAAINSVPPQTSYSSSGGFSGGSSFGGGFSHGGGGGGGGGRSW